MSPQPTHLYQPEGEETEKPTPRKKDHQRPKSRKVALNTKV